MLSGRWHNPLAPGPARGRGPAVLSGRGRWHHVMIAAARLESNTSFKFELHHVLVLLARVVRIMPRITVPVTVAGKWLLGAAGGGELGVTRGGCSECPRKSRVKLSLVLGGCTVTWRPDSPEL